MLNFCTLFNINYLAKGLALHQSLTNSCQAFHIYIFAFDEDTYQILNDRQLANATILQLSSVESAPLLQVKAERSIPEYCWTCKPFIIKYCITEFALPNCSYIDGDTYFYNDPVILYSEMGDNSVLITPHNYYALYDQSATSGIYCAQLVIFKNTTEGNHILNWWADACLKWCSSTYEGGKWADQKYLDSWPYMFNGVHICRNIGAGLAPWNLLNYSLSSTGKQLMVNEIPLVFYHFHDLQYLSNNTWYLGGYDITKHILTEIYQPYIKTLLNIDKEIKSQHTEVDSLYKKDVNTFSALSDKYKVGIYALDLKMSLKKFMRDLFFIDRRKHYINNYIKLK